MKLRWDRFQIFAMASALGAFVLMVAGGFVTQTESGLGCPDWPLCHGQVVPDFGNPATAIEWTHRTIAAIVGVLVLLTALFAWRDRKSEKRILLGAFVSLFLVIVQAGLGAAVVYSELGNKPLIVLHLSVAAAFFAVAVVTAVLAFLLPKTATSLDAVGVEGTTTTTEGPP